MHRDRLTIFREILKSLPRGRLLDLATGHGRFAKLALELGWDVTAVDARTDRMPMTEGIEWIQADAREFPVEGYDVISILGLLYHLELDAQIELLGRCAPALTVIDTHVSLSPTSMVDGYLGHFYIEPDGVASSWGNRTSFWPTEDSLLRLLLGSGFTSLFKVLPPPVRSDRTFYIASLSPHGDLEELVRQFNSAGEFRIEPRLAEMSSGASSAIGRDRGEGTSSDLVKPEVVNLRVERDDALDRLRRIESRKSVRVAVRVANLVKPVYRRFSADEVRSLAADDEPK